jgi:Uma2 family endonuclease
MHMAAMAESVGLDRLSLEGLRLPITLRVPVPLSDEQLMAFSYRNRPYRIELNAKGEIEIMTPVGGDGGRWEILVGRELSYWAEEQGGVVFGSSTGFRLPDGSVLSPDAAWISDARWSALTKAEQRSFPPVCPEFLIEILSASDSRTVLENKMGTWVANGAQLAWMIDPYAATLSIYTPDKPVEVLERPDSVEAGQPVAGFRLTTSRLWD